MTDDLYRRLVRGLSPGRWELRGGPARSSRARNPEITALRLSGARSRRLGISVRPATPTIRSGFGSASSNGTFPATGAIASIFNFDERTAESNAMTSSTPGSVSMITGRGVRV
jgi:hypothetical protein